MSTFPRQSWQRSKFFLATACVMGIEPLEQRQLLSAARFLPDPHFGGPTGPTQVLNTIEFSQAPAAVQSGLDTLATHDGLTDPTATQSVRLDNLDGIETYSVTIDGTGSVNTLTVDQNGNPVTAPTTTQSTWATLDGTGAGSDAAAAAEISAIATALNLTAPADLTVVNVTAYSDGIVTYSLSLPGASGRGHRRTLISVDGSGNPVGDEQLPFDVIPADIQNALNSNAPSGATSLATSSTQNVKVQTADGVTTYSTQFVVTGITSVVTVNSSGQLTSLPSFSATEFADLLPAVQSELQTLANDYGVTGTISATQKVQTYTESNGTVIYAVTLSAAGTRSSGRSFTYAITIAVDEDGNPTTLPGGEEGRGGGCGGGILEGNFPPRPGDLFIR